jgi:hypothetical protein
MPHRRLSLTLDYDTSTIAAHCRLSLGLRCHIIDTSAWHYFAMQAPGLGVFAQVPVPAEPKPFDPRPGLCELRDTLPWPGWIQPE